MAKSAPGGYCGTILRIDLSRESTTIEPIDDAFCRKYLGGAGFIAHCLLSEMKPGRDPLGPDNRLVFATGPLTGLNFPGSARHAVGAKSPLTGGIAKSEAGEHWGAHLKRAGFDALIIEGRSKRPVYLWIHNGGVEIRDARSIWGKRTKQTQESIRSELGDAGVRVAMIGPGGENLVRFACIMHGSFDAAGRGGMGAVMGAKNLKAVAVRGDRPPRTARSDGVRETVRWFKENRDLMKNFSDYGTGSPIARFEEVGNLPVRNFRDGGFPRAKDLSPQAIKETIRVGMEGCFACPVRCKKIVESKGPFALDRAYGGPEYETLAALGSACGIDDLHAVAKASELCNAYGLDTISTGMTIAFAMECFDAGILSPDEVGGLALRFGDAGVMLQAIERIAAREGLGDILADGSARAAERIGRGAEAFAMHVKGLEIPMHEPRLSKSLGLGYMINPHGADHMDSMIDLFFSGFGQHAQVMVPDAIPLGLDPAGFSDIGPKKVALFCVHQSKRILADSLAICHFLPYSLAQITRLTASVTGWDTSVMEQLRIAERILTMCRIFNLREGLSWEHDRLPERFFGPTNGGPLHQRFLDPVEMERAVRYYYFLRGWDARGVPIPEKLEELGIDHLGPKAQ